MRDEKKREGGGDKDREVETKKKTPGKQRD